MTSAQIDVLLVAVVVAASCAIPGTFLVLRRMAMMSDAISHTVLLGIVLAFFVVADLNSPILILGAALVGLLTVVLVEVVSRTGLVREDTAIGLVFPALFSIAVILISSLAGNVHLDSDAVLLGEIAFAPFNRFAPFGVDLGPIALWVMGAILLVNLAGTFLFFKELKLATFDPALAAALGFSPALVHYGLMAVVSVTAVGAFDAVGSFLVVALMIGPPAAAYLLTDRLPRMLVYSSLIGAAGAYSGYELARGNLLGILNLSNVLAGLNDLFGPGLSESWDSSISASLVPMTFFFFLVAWAFSPKYGPVSTMLRRRNQRRSFDHQVVLGHIHHHQGSASASDELAASTLYRHFRWTPAKMQRTLRQLRARNLVQIEANLVSLTERGETHAHQFRETQLTNESVGE